MVCLPLVSNVWRQTFAQVDRGRLAHNARMLKARLGPGVRMMAGVKADAYGHGAVEASRIFLSAGADALGVATLEEAVDLRAAGISADILVYGKFWTASAESALLHDVALTVYEAHELDVLAAAAGSGRRARVHVKLDTGMTRLGVRDEEEAVELIVRASGMAGVELEGVYTHFASADEPLSAGDDGRTAIQAGRLERVVMQARARGAHIPLVHAANSAALLRGARYHYDMVRPGIALYGYEPAPAWGIAHDLLPALSLRTQIVRIAEVAEGTPVSYGGTYVTGRTARIATLPVGYADGVPRSLSNVGSVRLEAGCAPIVGRVCMDQMMIDVTDLDVRQGDEVELYGGSGQCGSAQVAADQLGTITYELLCAISRRVPRVYA